VIGLWIAVKKVRACTARRAR